MCLSTSRVIGIEDWNWDGDTIIQHTIVPSARPAIGTRPPQEYPIDVREYLVTDRNAVMRRAINEDIPVYIRKEKGDEDLWRARCPGSFDYRAAVIANFVADTISYKTTRGRDPWQFPDETLAIQRGDCEDRAFLLGSLLISSGISAYNMRVAFGQMVVGEARHDHMWVVYKTEAGRWTILEPLRLGGALDDAHLRTKATRQPHSVRYEPQFLFNDTHLWAVGRMSTAEGLDRFLQQAWVRLTPKFAGEVHESIIETALSGLPPDAGWVLKELKRNFSRLLLFGPIVESVDLDYRHYSPLDHCDNGYLAETWQRITENLQAFRDGNRENIQRFGRAAHAISDIYAHTSYLHFATLVAPEKPEGYANPINLANPDLATVPNYAAPDFDLQRFSTNTSIWGKPAPAAAIHWGGKLISGRYAQPNDTHGTLVDHLTEGLTFIPESLLKAPDFFYRGGLPHHREIAVDEPTPGKGHRLYTSNTSDPADRCAYQNQFRWRKNTAVRHIRQVFMENWNGIPLH